MQNGSIKGGVSEAEGHLYPGLHPRSSSKKKKEKKLKPNQSSEAEQHEGSVAADSIAGYALLRGAAGDSAEVGLATGLAVS